MCPISNREPQKTIHPFLSLLAAFAISTGISVAKEPLNPNFDISGVREFWKIVDILQMDQEPTEEQWKALFDTPGHNALRREFEDGFFMKYFRAACMPSQAHVREELLQESEKASGWFDRWFPKSELEALEWTLRNREKVILKMESFETFPYTRLAMKEALRFLPEKEISEYPNVAFVIFNDSRGYEPVVMSLNILVQEDESITPEILKLLEERGYGRNHPHVLYFAHEFFHFFRARKKEFQFPEKNHEDYTLVWILDQIENEGIADQINVKPLYCEDGLLSGTQEAQEELSGRIHAADEIRALDEILTGIVDHPDWKYGLSMQARRAITRSGHVAGMYMTDVILRHFQEEEIVKVARNPFQFFYMYNRAAEKDGLAPVFSPKAIGLIRELEGKYRLE